MKKIDNQFYTHDNKIYFNVIFFNVYYWRKSRFKAKNSVRDLYLDCFFIQINDRKGREV